MDESLLILEGSIVLESDTMPPTLSRAKTAFEYVPINEATS
jgi:hypothetical protein